MPTSDTVCMLCGGVAWWIDMPHVQGWKPIHKCIICGAEKRENHWYRIATDAGIADSPKPYNPWMYAGNWRDYLDG